MAIALRRWDSISAEENVSLGNHPHTVTLRESGKPAVQEVVMAAGYQVGPQGELHLSLRAPLDDDPDHVMPLLFKTYAPGGWHSVEADNFAYDIEGLLRQQEENERKAAEMSAAARLGVMPGANGAGGNRQMRRHPGGPG